MNNIYNKIDSQDRPRFSVERNNKPLPKYKKILLVVLLPWITVLSCWRILNDPLTLYGMVVDQNNKPISDVRITAKIIGKGRAGFLPVPDPSWVTRIVHRKTDEDGCFKITGYYGGKISFNLRDNNAFLKPGYSLIRERSMSLDSYELIYTINNPKIYKMKRIDDSISLQINDTNIAICPMMPVQQEKEPINGFTSFDLKAQPLSHGRLSHSRQFKSNIVDEWGYWRQVLRHFGLLQDED